jgi:hypothetical protein
MSNPRVYVVIVSATVWLDLLRDADGTLVPVCYPAAMGTCACGQDHFAATSGAWRAAAEVSACSIVCPRCAAAFPVHPCPTVCKSVSIDYRKRSLEPFLVFLRSENGGATWRDVSPQQWAKTDAMDVTSAHMRESAADVAWATARGRIPFGQVMDKTRELRQAKPDPSATDYLAAVGLTYCGTKA